MSEPRFGARSDTRARIWDHDVDASLSLVLILGYLVLILGLVLILRHFPLPDLISFN